MALDLFTGQAHAQVIDRFLELHPETSQGPAQVKVRRVIGHAGADSAVGAVADGAQAGQFLGGERREVIGEVLAGLGRACLGASATLDGVPARGKQADPAHRTARGSPG
ncbi:hypothetical protein ACFUJT_28620 [Streptomyces griseoincarnatus]